MKKNEIINDNGIPRIIASAIELLLAPEIIRLVNVSGNKGEIIIRIENGAALSIIPKLEMKKGFEIKTE